MVEQKICHPRHVSIELELAMINGDYFWLLSAQREKKSAEGKMFRLRPSINWRI